MDQQLNLKSKVASATVVEALRALLLEGVVGTQEEIKQSLQRQGMIINQSKISRLLRKVGAVKMINEEGESVYSLPRDLMLPSAQSPLSQMIISIVANETVIVIHTNPGSASLISRLLDHQTAELEILGTLAGDDTILIVPQSIQNIKRTIEALKKRLYTESSGVR